jgi:hypothetical protein
VAKGFRPRNCIKSWDQHPPSRRDAMIMLTFTLNLLAESMPLALARVSQEDLNTQECFWRELMTFDGMVDMLYGINLVDDRSSVKSRLDDLADLVQERANNPVGNIEG